MSAAAIANLRLGILIVALVAGVALHKADHHGQHTDCTQCVTSVERG